MYGRLRYADEAAMIIPITTILFGLARGLYEGMIMHPDGVRHHVAFWSYHALGVAMFIAFGRLVYLMARKRFHWLYIVGLILILWECTEIGYSVARFGGIKSYEHIVFADLIDVTIYGAWVYVMHAVRILIGIGLMYKKTWKGTKE